MFPSKWKLIRNILNWFGVYSNSKPEFLLLVVKSDKCFMVKPFKSTYNTQWYTQIGPNIHLRIIIDSLLLRFFVGKIANFLNFPTKLSNWSMPLHASILEVKIRIRYRITLYYDNGTKYWKLFFCVFGLFEVIKFQRHNRC